MNVRALIFVGVGMVLSVMCGAVNLLIHVSANNINIVNVDDVNIFRYILILVKMG